MEHEILFLSEADVQQLLSADEVMEASENVFREVGGDKVNFARESFLTVGSKPVNRFMANPVSIPEQGVLGVKWINMYMAPKPGYPFSHGNLIILNDTETGSPLAIVGATSITAMRTGGGHAAVAAKYLSVKSPQKLAVLGCGAQGKSGIRSFTKIFPSLREVRVFDAYRPSAEQAAQTAGIPAYVAGGPQDAVEGADLVLLSSASKDVLVKAEWIKPGVTVIGINAFQDLDPAVAGKADKLVLGHAQSDKTNVLNNPMLSHGVDLSGQAFYGDMGEIVCGRKAGRENDQEIIVYVHMGMGAFDVECAHLAYKRALEKGMGTKLAL